MKTNILGLPVKETEATVKELNTLLSNFSSLLPKLERYSLEY